jgi:hypothetical protein
MSESKVSHIAKVGIGEKGEYNVQLEAEAYPDGNMVTYKVWPQTPVHEALEEMKAGDKVEYVLVPQPKNPKYKMIGTIKKVSETTPVSHTRQQDWDKERVFKNRISAAQVAAELTGVCREPVEWALFTKRFDEIESRINTGQWGVKDEAPLEETRLEPF